MIERSSFNRYWLQVEYRFKCSVVYGGPGSLLLLIFKREFLKFKLHGNEMLKNKYSDYTIKNSQYI